MDNGKDIRNEGMLEPSFFCDQWFVFRGVLFCRCVVFDPDGEAIELAIIRKGGGRYTVPPEQCHMPSSDVAEMYGAKQANSRFDIRLPLFPSDACSAVIGELELEIKHRGGTTAISDPTRYALALDPALKIGNRFNEILSQQSCGTLIEIGARARSGQRYWNGVNPSIQYVGFDIVDGPNVDIVGDAHQISRYFEAESVDYVCSVATFEHLAMPWRVAVEVNQILKCGGMLFIAAPQTWPTHDEPWDFHRFSKWSWKSIFNEDTGYEILEVAQGMPCHVVPMLAVDNQILDNQPGWLMSAVLAQKTRRATVKEDVTQGAVLGESIYPA